MTKLIDSNPYLKNKRFMPSDADMSIQDFGKRCFEEGVAAGKARVRARVKAEAYAWGLVRLLEKRFGAVSEAVHARISAADLVSIETWFDRAIEATDLESVFDGK